MCSLWRVPFRAARSFAFPADTPLRAQTETRNREGDVPVTCKRILRWVRCCRACYGPLRVLTWELRAGCERPGVDWRLQRHAGAHVAHRQRG